MAAGDEPGGAEGVLGTFGDVGIDLEVGVLAKLASMLLSLDSMEKAVSTSAAAALVSFADGFRGVVTAAASCSSEGAL